MHTIPKSSEDKIIFFNRLCANNKLDGSIGNCLASNDNAIFSLLDDNRNTSGLCDLYVTLYTLLAIHFST